MADLKEAQRVFRSQRLFLFPWLGLWVALVLTGCPSQQPTPSSQQNSVSGQHSTTTLSGKNTVQDQPTKQRRVRIISMTPMPNPQTRLHHVRVVPNARLLPKPEPGQKIVQPSTQPAPRGALFSKALPTPRKLDLPKIDPKTVFYPIPFPLHLNAVEKRYSSMYEAADKLKVGALENIFLKELYQERRREGLSGSYRNQMVRLAGIRYLRLRGLKNYQLMGYRSLQQMEQLLQEYLAEGGSPLAVPQGKSRLATLAQKLTAHIGYYPMLLKQVGIKPDTKTVDRTQRFWLRTLFLARWGLQAWGVYPLPAMLGKEVYLDYQKARVLWTKNFQRRLFALRECRRLDPQFPVHRVLGWLFLQVGRSKMALSSFRDALRIDPHDQLSRSLLDKLLQPPT